MRSTAVFLMLCAVFTLARADEPKPAAPPAAVQPATDVKPDAEAGKPASEAKDAPEAKPVAKPGAQAITEAQIKQMRGRGYKPVNRNGTLVFCRTEGQIGTHFERTRCSTIDELKQAELTGKEYVNSIQQQGSPTPFKGP